MKKQKQPDGQKKTKSRASKKKKGFVYSWPFKAILISLVMTVAFSLLSELASSAGGVAVSIILIIFFLAVALVSDALAVAVTSCEIGPLTAMAARKINGAKIAIRLVNNAEKAASLFGDVIGDICGIVGGVCAAALAVKLSGTLAAPLRVLTVALSAVLAAATIGCKSYIKSFAIKRNKDIVMAAAKLMTLFAKKH